MLLKNKYSFLQRCCSLLLLIYSVCTALFVQMASERESSGSSGSSESGEAKTDDTQKKEENN